MVLTRYANFLFCGSALAIASICLGCGASSPADRIKIQEELSGKKAPKAYPLGGRVTIDGQPPSAFLSTLPGKPVLEVMLYDLDNPKAPPRNWPSMPADADGHFEYSFEGIGDGRPAGNYVFVFAVLNDRKKKGKVGPDQLKNLYNDPEKNEKDPRFKIHHEAPGKSDYSIDLAIAGQSEGTTGPKSVVQLNN